MPEFSTDWLSHHLAGWPPLFNFARWDPNAPKVAVEIGSFEGRSALWMLDNMLLHPDSRIHCIDTFEGSPEHGQAQKDGLFDRFCRNIIESPHKAKVTAYRKASFPVLAKLYTEGLRADFVYVDGSHAAPDVLADCVLAFGLLKVGGLMICDDYLWSQEPHGSEILTNAPKIAIDAFVNIHRQKLRIPRQGNQQVGMIKLRD